MTTNTEQPQDEQFNPDRLITEPRTLGDVYAREAGRALITECCGRAIGPDCRFCPKCGQEARIESADAPPVAEVVAESAAPEGQEPPERIWVTEGLAAVLGDPITYGDAVRRDIEYVRASRTAPPTADKFFGCCVSSPHAGPCTPSADAEVRAKAKQIADDWFPTERGKHDLINRIVTAFSTPRPEAPAELVETALAELRTMFPGRLCTISCDGFEPSGRYGNSTYVRIHVRPDGYCTGASLAEAMNKVRERHAAALELARGREGK